MGHTRSQIFEQYYLSQRVKRDVQAAFLGRPTQDALIQAVGAMSLSRDPRAPKELTPEQLSAVNHHPRVVELLHARNDLSREIRLLYGMIKKAKGTEIYLKHKKVSLELSSEISHQKTLLLKEVRKEFFRTIDTQEVERQLTGSTSISSESKYTGTGTINYTFEERCKVAEMLFTQNEDLAEPDVALRVRAVTSLVALCKLREEPRRRKQPPSQKWAICDVEDIPEPDLFPLMCTGTQCLFCLGDEHLSYSARTFSFCRIDALRRHVQVAHLRYLAAEAAVPCPHPACHEILQDTQHFKNHAATVHNIFL
jgi:Protein of unknown function (DUF3435)